MERQRKSLAERIILGSVFVGAAAFGSFLLDLSGCFGYRTRVVREFSFNGVPGQIVEKKTRLCGSPSYNLILDNEALTMTSGKLVDDLGDTIKIYSPIFERGSYKVISGKGE